MDLSQEGVLSVCKWLTPFFPSFLGVVELYVEKLKRGSKATSFNVKLADVEAFVDECKDFGALVYVLRRALARSASYLLFFPILTCFCKIVSTDVSFLAVSTPKMASTPRKARIGSRRVSRSTS